MIEPKIFYRKLDEIQKKIGKEKSGKDFLQIISKEIENTFGELIHLTNPCIYENNDDEFILIYNSRGIDGLILQDNIKADEESVKALLENKIYIYDKKDFTFPGWENISRNYLIPAGLIVQSPETKWIFLFQLSEGWIREEIEFCLNAVRTALNYRLTSESVKNEVEQAVHIQKSLLPQEAPEIQGLDICGKSVPAELVGGDIYDYFSFNGEGFGFCIGDASGHGLPAALLARDAITGLRMGLEKHMKMLYTLKKLNKVIYRSVYSTRFISLFYAEMEENGNLFYANAGHPAPLVFTGNNFIQLESTGSILGALPELEITRAFIQLNPDDILILFSDGIVERQNLYGEDFGEERLKDIIRNNKHLSAKELNDLIFEEVIRFGDTPNFSDDATLLIIKKLS